MKTVLYVSYDGMTDPLGRSQVMPYLIGLADRGHAITVLSCEKAHHLELLGRRCESLLAKRGIEWHHVPYSKRPPVLSTYLDLAKMHRLGGRLAAERKFDIVHCRTVLAALVGTKLARRSGAKLLFDMRGFWADERVDGSLWSLSNPLYRALYRYFKHREQRFFKESDLVIALTRRAEDHIRSECAPEDVAAIKVVPCCVDTAHFSPDSVDSSVLAQRRRELDLRDDDFVLVYVGSLGTRYMLTEMMEFFAVLAREDPRARFLFVTREAPALVHAAANAVGVAPSSISVVASTYDQVPEWIALADAAVFFIKTGGVSGKAVSPTKQGELLAMGVPVVCNAGIGDCDEIVGDTGAGIVLADLGAAGFGEAVSRLRAWDGGSSQQIRQVAIDRLSLASGVERYHQAWEAL